MVSVSEATSIVQQHFSRPTRENVKIESLEGRILADAIIADHDYPPFDRVAMDGIAIYHESFREGWRDFKVEGTQAAGQPRTTLRDNHNCIEVMTGAMLPIGCDTVIRYEDVSLVNKIAKVKVESIEKGQSIHNRAHDAKRGDTLLPAGMQIFASEVAIIASVGKSEAAVCGFPRTAIISTGNELVDIHDRPQPHQIRRSNVYALQGALTTMGCRPALFHLPDDHNAMERELIKVFAAHDLIILSGGVSQGKFDLVPQVMESLGVSKLFHQVSQKPGKPFWFGASKKQLVFAFPGNPVSNFLCFYRYLKPWLLGSMGSQKPFGTAILASDFTFKLELTYFLQVKTVNESGRLMAYPREGGGSGDFANLKEADGFLELPADRNEFKAGDTFPYIPFRN